MGAESSSVVVTTLRHAAPIPEWSGERCLDMRQLCRGHDAALPPPPPLPLPPQPQRAIGNQWLLDRKRALR